MSKNAINIRPMVLIIFLLLIILNVFWILNFILLIWKNDGENQCPISFFRAFMSPFYFKCFINNLLLSINMILAVTQRLMAYFIVAWPNQLNYISKQKLCHGLWFNDAIKGWNYYKLLRRTVILVNNKHSNFRKKY